MNQPTVLYHVSDLHFGYEDRAALDWFAAEVARERPAAVICTGDLTMRGSAREFALAAQWLADLPVPVSLEPGTVNTGLMMTVLPRIVEGNKILMRLSIAITDAQQPFATFTSGSGDSAASIQLPEVETTGFLQNAVVTSGETLVMAGFEKKQSSTIDDGTPYVPILGGGKATNRSREISVMLITSEILPEDPITVIGNQ